MSYDLEVLVINQLPVPILFSTSIEVLNEVDDMIFRFEDTWKFMSQPKGTCTP